MCFPQIPCIPLHLLSSCTFRSFFDKPPCPTSLNIILYPSHWQPPPTVPRQKRQPPFPLRCRPSLTYISSLPTKLSHISTYPTSSSLQSRFTIPLIAIRFEFLYPSILLPNTGRIPDRMICSTLASFVFFSSLLYLSTIAVVSVLARIWIFFKKKELLNFFRELFAKERSFPFHGENLANVYQMRVLYARTCLNHLVNRRFRTL